MFPCCDYSYQLFFLFFFLGGGGEIRFSFFQIRRESWALGLNVVVIFLTRRLL